MFLCEGVIGESIMALCTFYGWIMSAGEGDSGVCIWFGAPTMHRISGLNLAWYWHVACAHVHLSSQFETIWSGGLLLWLPASVNVKNHVSLLACSVWGMRWTALLCCAILRPFMNGFSHVDRWCGVSLLWYNVQLGFWCVRAKKYFSYDYPYIGHTWMLKFGWFGHLLPFRLSKSG